MELKNIAIEACLQAIKENMPKEAVKRALSAFECSFGKTMLLAVGKAGWEMASTAAEALKGKIDGGVVITKYGHSKGALEGIEIYEAAHPVVDFNGICATKRALEMTKNLSEGDTVLFLVSGGGSALFESPLCTLEQMQGITSDLIRCGASINEINAVRKHLSGVKGGRLAKHIAPARVFTVALSDVIGDDLSTIASGPTAPDNTTCDQCLEIIKKYNLCVSEGILNCLRQETPKTADNATHIICGSVSELCQSAKNYLCDSGFDATVVDDKVTCDVNEMKERLERIYLENKDKVGKKAFIFGGEITVNVRGNGKGGRNQHLALSCGDFLKGDKDSLVLCVGSDGTDGPTDAAGGFCDGTTWESIRKKGKDPRECLKNSDSYNALSLADSLIVTGPTGTNVNDLYILIIKR